MTTEKIKVLLDSCFIGKRVTETIKPLPDGFKPRYIHVIEGLYTLGKDGEPVCVSDISRFLNLTMPSVTKLINELEEKKVLTKHHQDEDKRVTLVSLTNLGLEYQDKYVCRYHKELSSTMSDVTDEDVSTVFRVISRLLEETLKGNNNE